MSVCATKLIFCVFWNWNILAVRYRICSGPLPSQNNSARNEIIHLLFTWNVCVIFLFYDIITLLMSPFLLSIKSLKSCQVLAPHIRHPMAAQHNHALKPGTDSGIEFSWNEMTANNVGCGLCRYSMRFIKQTEKSQNKQTKIPIPMLLYWMDDQSQSPVGQRCTKMSQIAPVF